MFILRSRTSYRLFWLILCSSLFAAAIAVVRGITFSSSLMVVAAAMVVLFLLITILSIFAAGRSGLTGMSLLPEWKPEQDETPLKRSSP
jgi:hypothetical protein